MSKHTPGPWYLEDAGESDRGKLVSIDSSPLRIIARPDWHGNHEEYMANARLIAAAPELLEALKLCDQRMKELQELTDYPFAWPRLAAREAIAKAEGGT